MKSDCIKLQVLDAIELAARGVTQINEVHMNVSSPRKREEYAMPVLFIADDREKIEGNNRLEESTLPLICEIWAAGEDVGRTLENARAALKTALYDSHVIRSLGVVIQEKGSKKYTFTDDDSAGAIVAEYEVRYHTKRKNPFTQNGY